ncbi:hypothetical protein C2845_PM04G07080 [Panicum miliaceum]|uniref:Bifunctional inhibitor/plant lipid transfer protein/seed storage helical domain-containing protein n=1 Tax=Panicum miliaceum TaxID=4540 RepID=A0A3L6QP54_PANMI|nr:hypothetical protein C2845_PM04G07080 [Panicum miliaceum]
MASTTSRLILSAAALLSILLLAGAATAAATTSVPSYCASGQAIPRSPLPGCRWYIASRICDMMVLMYPPAVFRELCCQQLRAVPAECRCRALRVMMEETALTIGGDRGSPICSQVPQARFAPAVVTKGECGLPTIHGTPFCHALDAE